VGYWLTDFHIHCGALINLTNAEVKAVLPQLQRCSQSSSENREIKEVQLGSWPYLLCVPISSNINH